VGVFKCLSVTGLLNTLFLLGVLSGAGNDQLSISQIKINDQDDEFMILNLIFSFFLHVI
jgi:hypothetical protein